MKNLTKMFMAVAVLFAGFACTTDVTENLGVSVAGQTEITLSLEESRTQLGEKADGVYPLYWSEGDQIAVNGVTSDEVAAESVGTASATFVIGGVMTYPYNIVYPAPAEGISAEISGCYPVAFPATQVYKADNVDGDAIPMYGYIEEGAAPILNHLTGVLRIAVKGSATLSSLTITSGGGAIAGTFDVNCADGTLTPQIGSTSNTISMSFGEGLPLSETATPIYVAVPAGSYGKVSIDLFSTAGEKMVVKFDTVEKPIQAGMVREFVEFEYKGVASDEFVIDSVDALIAFAANPTKDARVAANLDLTGVAWTPIEGFAHTFDGGNFEIKGLTAPLFGTTSGSFKNVKLVDINIVETTDPTTGALARRIAATSSEAPIVDNCLLSGKFTVNVKDFTPTVTEDKTIAAMGALVGYAHGVKITNCVNEAVVDIQSVMSPATTLTSITCCGGLVGYAIGETSLGAAGSIENCENKASFTYTNGSYSTTFGLSTRLGGVAGQVDTCVVVKRVTNRGKVSVSGPFNGSNTNNIGGALGCIVKISAEDVTNYGTVSLESGHFGSVSLGGAVGYGSYLIANNLHNYGAISTAEGVTHYHLVCGGIAGKHVDNVSYSIMSNSTNNAPITILSDMDQIKSGYFRIGGCIGWGQNGEENITNNAEGVITIKSKLYNADDLNYSLAISGGVAYQTQSSVPTAITNNAPINIDCTVTTSSTYTDYGTVRLNVGGIIGYFDINNLVTSGHLNTGDINVTANTVGDIRVGGIFGQCNDGKVETSKSSGNITIKTGAKIGYSLMIGGIGACSNGDAISTLENSGDITVEENVTVGAGLNVAGGIGYSLKTATAITNSGNVTIKSGVNVAKAFYVAGGIARASVGATTLTNSGNVTIYSGKNGTISGAAAADKMVNIGGGAGYIEAKITFDGVINSGDITVSGFSPAGVFSLGGCIGRFSNDTGGTIKNSKNTGAILVDENTTMGGGCYVGGVLGLGNKDGSGQCSYSENDGPITLRAKASAGDNYIGGVAGYLNLGGTNYSLTNGANGDLLVHFAATGKHEFSVGGVAGRMVDHISGITNLGDITIKGKIADYARISGIVAYPNNYTRRNVLNDATITLDGEVVGNAYLGGIIGSGGYGGLYHNVQNKGKLHVTKNAVMHTNAYVGGIYGNLNTTNQILVNCYNSAEILFEGTSGADGGDSQVCIGGMIGASLQFRSIQHDFANSGNVTFKGTHKGTGRVAIGGVMGYNEAVYLGEGFSTYDETGTKLEATATGPVYHNCKVANTGSVTCEGGTNAYVGGWVGYTATPIANGAIACSINGGTSQNVGMVMGIPYAEATKVSNCQVGGTFVGAYDIEDEEFKTISLDASNYFKYMYSSEISQETAEADQCSYVSSIE